DEVVPALAEGDGDEAGVEDGEVGEEAGWIILAGGEEEWGEEAAEEAEDGDDLGIEADGEEKRGAGDARHEGEGGRGLREMVKEVSGEGDGVEGDDAGGAEGLGGDGELGAGEAQAADDQAEAACGADGDAHLRGDEIVLEGVFDEEGDAEEEGEAAEPGEEL